MVFSSLFFIYAFFPLCMLIYWLTKDIKAKNIVLLVFSIVFYTWGEPVYVSLLILMTFCDWVSALLIQNVASNKGTRRFFMILATIINLSMIGVFKYATFFLTNVKAIAGFPQVIPQIALPIGISFYTFQLLSYVVDVYRREVPAQKNFFWLLLYSSLYYQCIAGPIVRYSDVQNEIMNRHTNLTQVCDGITRFTVGLAKKALIANMCGSLSDSLLISDKLMSDPSLLAQSLTQLSSRSAIGVWFGMIFYMLQIYLDFSAYSDMAIGMGLMVGFHFKENFNYPYIASSVTDFWRRWHISLSTFFRDYVYIPLGGNRKGKAKTYRNIFIVWLLTGLWHGASWNFVLWGLYYCLFLILEKAGLLKKLEAKPKFVGHLYLLLVVFFGWILFRYKDFAFIPVILRGLFGLNGNSFLDFETQTVLKGNFFFILVAVLSVTPLVPRLGKLLKAKGEESFGGHIYRAVSVISPVVLLFLSTLALVGDSYNPFLYFQF